jgi:hypothetical protein
MPIRVSQSPLMELDESRSARYLDDTDVVENLNGGVWDSKLAHRRGLVHESFNEVFRAIDSYSISREVQDPMVKPTNVAISGKAIVRDIKSGMTGLQLMAKYGFSSSQLKKAVELVLKERRRIAMAIAEDVRSGLTAGELKKKHQLSDSGLETAFRRLLAEGLLEAANIENLEMPFDMVALFGHERRQAPRLTPSLPITVYDRGGRGTKGSIKDISEKGLGVRGIGGVVGESKTLLIVGDDFGLVDPFEVEAECRWVGTEGPDGQQVARFQIIAISEEDLKRLQELISLPELESKVIS